MAKTQLRSIIANSQAVHDMLKDTTNLAEWVQSKITKAEDYISTVADYMTAEMNEQTFANDPVEDAKHEAEVRAKMKEMQQQGQGTKIIHLQHQGPTIGGAAPVATSKDVLKSLEITIPNKKSLDNDKQIQAKIAEIKQIQADMAKIFADWRDEVYNIFTQPDDIKNAYYQTQTPFTILTHIMVCSGLFGPLTSGKYIDVKKEENKELHDKLNLIAGAFVTMNNGYLSMSNVKMQLMIEDAKKATITTVEKVGIEGPTVEVREDIDIDKTLIGPGPAEMINREELVAGFGGNKKYSRRKRRKYSKRQRKGCRRKSNKRFYSKKVTKNRR
jgi:hypothetical protein